MTGASPSSSGKGCAQGGLRQWAELCTGSQSPPGLAIAAVGPGTSFPTLQSLSSLIYEMGEFTAISWAADRIKLCTTEHRKRSINKHSYNNRC